jgi:hypothetical protein
MANPLVVCDIYRLKVPCRPRQSCQAAEYEQLLMGAHQVFRRSTMQGRNQQRLEELRWGARCGAFCARVPTVHGPQ